MYWEKKLHVSETVQFRSMLFKGQLYTFVHYVGGYAKSIVQVFYESLRSQCLGVWWPYGKHVQRKSCLAFRIFFFNWRIIDIPCFWCTAKWLSYMCVCVYIHISVQFSLVAQSCPTLCNPMNRSTPGLPVHHQLPEFTQTHVHRVDDAIQPSRPLSSPSPLTPNPSQHQGLFQWVISSHQVAKVLEFQLQHQSFQWTPRTDLL